MWPCAALFAIALGPERLMDNGFDLVRDGSASAAIVVTTDEAGRAAGVLQDYVSQMSGATVPLSDAASIAVRFEIDEGLDEDGFLFSSSREGLTIGGGSGQGQLYGVYSLLEELGCRMWTENEIDVPSLSTVHIPALNEVHEPRVKFRVDYYSHAEDPGYREWHKLDSIDDSEWGMWVHTFERLLPADEHFDNHPEYYALVDGRRTSSQPELANPDVFALIVENLRKEMSRNKSAHYWSVSQNDNVSNSTSPESLAVQAQYGGASGEMIWFVNRVAEEFPDKTISTLAYQYTRQPPGGVVPLPNVNIVLCSIEALRHKPLVDDPLSADFCADVEGWGKLTSNILVWDYMIQFANLTSPFPNLRVLQPNLQYLVSKGVTGFFMQGNRDPYGEFSELRSYLTAKLLWDPDLDFEAELDGFLDGYYGPSGRVIRGYIDLMHDSLEASGEGLDIFGSPIGVAYLSPSLMAQYTELFDEAEALAEGVYVDRVRRVRMPLTYALIEQAKAAGSGPGGIYVQDGDSISVRPGVKEMGEGFVADLKRFGVPRVTEWAITPDEYMVDLRLRTEGEPYKALSFGKAVRFEDCSPDERYALDGPAALTDGVLGGITFRLGSWLGFNGQHVSAVVDLGAVVPVTSVSLGAHQDQINWIFHPSSVAFEGSVDGVHWIDLGSADASTEPRTGGFLREDFTVSVDADVRYVRAKAESILICPSWHVGAGQPAFMFVDELIVR
jgi:hypothetical protein